MEFDFKITTWERVKVSKEQEEKVLQAIKDGKVNSANDIFNLLGEEGDMNVDCQKLDNVEEQMTVEENGGNSTIEVREGGEYLYHNGDL
jgi:hypothetical protein